VRQLYTHREPERCKDKGGEGPRLRKASTYILRKQGKGEDDCGQQSHESD